MRLFELGFQKGSAAPTVFYHREKGMRCVAHGDDFTFTGRRRDLLEVKRRLEEVYELKMRAMLGDDSNDDKEITIRNRTIRW